MNTKIRPFICLFAIVPMIGLGCGKKSPVKHKVKGPHINALDSSLLVKANEEKKAWDDAKREHKIEREKLRLRKYDYDLAKQWHELAKLRATRMKFALGLQNKKVPVDLKPGAYAQARDDLALAEKNLEYRRLMYRFHRDMVELQRRRTFAMKAQYMESVVEALHKANHPSAKEYRRFQFAKQSANLKLKMAEVQEKVERAESRIKVLEKQVEPTWAPSFRKPAPQPQPAAAQ